MVGNYTVTWMIIRTKFTIECPLTFNNLRQSLALPIAATVLPFSRHRGAGQFLPRLPGLFRHYSVSCSGRSGWYSRTRPRCTDQSLPEISLCSRPPTSVRQASRRSSGEGLQGKCKTAIPKYSQGLKTSGFPKSESKVIRQRSSRSQAAMMSPRPLKALPP